MMSGFVRTGQDLPDSIEHLFAKVKRALISGGHIGEAGIWIVVLDAFDDATAKRSLQVRLVLRICRNTFCALSCVLGCARKAQLGLAQVLYSCNNGAGRHAANQASTQGGCHTTPRFSDAHGVDRLFARALCLSI